ncbi:hypothetical protein TNCV_3394431 [Trichonephila clavipes]|nr:hypothetical protein TNCV_3394431 [Trichonephila clavipes]
MLGTQCTVVATLLLGLQGRLIIPANCGVRVFVPQKTHCVELLKSTWCGSLKSAMPAQVSLSSLDSGSKQRDTSQITSVHKFLPKMILELSNFMRMNIIFLCNCPLKDHLGKVPHGIQESHQHKTGPMSVHVSQLEWTGYHKLCLPP